MEFWIWILIVIAILCIGRLYFMGRRCKIIRDISDKVIIITGASAGIGEYSAAQLAKMGGTVILACRNEEKTLPVIERIKKTTGNERVYYYHLDCSQLRTVEKFAQDFKANFSRLDILVHNAGGTSDDRVVTIDGFENVFQVNYLVPFYLTHLLIDCLKNSQPSRIIEVATVGHKTAVIDWNDIQNERNYFGLNAYAKAKLMGVMFAKELADRLKNTDVKTCSLHPGVVRTEIWGKYTGKITTIICWILMYPFFWYISRNIAQGSQTILQCSLMRDEELKSGAYYDDCVEAKMNPRATKENNLRLWKVTEDMLRKAGFNFESIRE